MDLHFHKGQRNCLAYLGTKRLDIRSKVNFFICFYNSNFAVKSSLVSVRFNMQCLT